MIRLLVLGSVELRASNGDAIDALLSQPRRLALLVYLALAPSGQMVRRDTLLALFWPDHDESHARNALSKALHHLRRELGPMAVTTRGDDEVGVDAALLWCDARAFAEAVEARQYKDGLTLYRGDLLPGFHVSGVAAEYAQWVDALRGQLRNQAAPAAWSLAESTSSAGHHDEARRWAQWAAAAAPDDERSLRRLMRMLADMGDRASALRAYELFARRLATEFDAAPSDESRNLAASMQGIVAGSGLAGNRGAAAEFVSAAPPIGASAEPGEEPGNITPTARRLPWPWLLAGAAAATVTLLLYAGSPQRSPVRPATPAVSTIAVLPFENLGPGHDDDYFADGMTDELISRLSQIGGLLVIGRSSAFAYKGKAVRAQDAGRSLGVATLLEGSVRREGSRVRLTAELLDTAHGYTLWSRTYDRQMSDVFAVQDELTRAIAAELRHRVSAPNIDITTTDASTDTLTYLLYLRGRYFEERHTIPAMTIALSYFARALARDSTFAPAYAAIAAVHSSLGGQGYRDNRRELALAKAAVERAVTLDSTLPAAYTSLGFISLFQEWRGDSAAADFTRALALRPNDAGTHLLYSMYWTAVGNSERAAAEAQGAMTLEPLSPLVLAHSGRVLFYAGQAARAEAIVRSAVELDSTYAPPYWALGDILLATHRARAAIPVFQRAERLSGLMLGDLGFAYAAAGDTTAARRYLKDMQRYARSHYVDAYERALVFTALRQGDSAFAWLDRAYAEHSAQLIWLRADPSLDGLRGDPRFTALIKRVGL